MSQCTTGTPSRQRRETAVDSKIHAARKWGKQKKMSGINSPLHELVLASFLISTSINNIRTG